MPEIIIKLGDQVVQKYYFYKDTVSIGRAPENEIAIENLAVSRRHAEIVKENGSYVLEDLNSANGTFVNGVQVTRTEIVDKDVIAVGKHKLYFYNHQQDGPMQLVEKTMLVTRPVPTKVTLRVSRGKQKDQVFEISKAETRIGRAADNDIRLGDWFVSKYHAEIVRKGLVFIIRDLASWRHTMVNGQVIDEQVLKPGDEIQFGSKIGMIFEVADGTAAREGSKRKPVELQSVDHPLPIAGREPDTPLPIAGSIGGGRLSNQDFANDASGDAYARSNGVADPQLEEDWEPESDSDLGDAFPGENAADAEGLEESGDEVSVAAEHEAEPVRLHEASDLAEAGWGEAGDLAQELSAEVEPAPSEVSASWSPDAESVEGASDEEDADGLAMEAAEEVEWVERIEVGAAQDEMSGPEADSGAGEEAVAYEDSARLESDADSDRAEQSEPAELAAHAESETSDVAAKAVESEACIEAGSPVSNGSSLVDSIMESQGPERGLDRDEIEMWVSALQNPSKIIRKQAQRQLQKLTGQVYDFQP